MFALLENKSVQMTSLEIAELVGSQHGNVRVSIERLAKAGAIILPATQIVENKQSLSANNKVTVYVFVGDQGRRDSIVVVAQLSPQFTAAIVDRWQELELAQSSKAISLPNFNDPVAAARAWADAKEGERNALVAFESAKPAIAFVENYVECTGNIGFREVCKLLKVKEPVFRQFLSDNRIMYRLGGEWTAYQNHIDAGRFYVNTGIASHNEHAYTAAKFTPKGVEWVAALWRNAKN